MKIVFYSTNSNKYAQGKLLFNMIPSCSTQWNELKKKYPEHEFAVVMQKPGMFLYDDVLSELHDVRDGQSARENQSAVDYIFIESENSSPEQIASVIIAQKPDIAIAVTYWTQPFDWMSIKDAMIAGLLREKGVRPVCHNAQTAAVCFDKWRTHQFLTEHGFNCAKGVYVHHELFYAERNKLMVEENIYREYVLSEIKKLKFPVVIKDTSGLSSFGMDVVTTFEEARHVLFSKKNNGDRLVEEFLEGPSFGIEVYGTDGKYTVTPPLINSVNQFGLTSPKQNVKLGPVGFDRDGGCGLENEKSTAARFNIDALQTEILRLAECLEFSGIAQIDLVGSGDKWYIIEINSRISGMTQTMAASMGLSLYELILFSAELIQWTGDYSYVMNLKFPLLSDSELELLYKQPGVVAVNQIENKEAKQLREVGYTEVIFGKTKTLDETMQILENLNKVLPDKMEKIFYENSKKLAQIIGEKV